MLSYKHEFHAGNHADVLKHTVLALILQYVKEKAKPFIYIDTHAGSGIYSLTSTAARKNAEFNTGIAKLWQSSSANNFHELEPYLSIIKSYNQSPKANLTLYPGSASIALNLLRKQDRCVLFELHNTEFAKLTQLPNKLIHPCFRRIQIKQQDGLSGLVSLLPPLEKRAVVFIDPSYELKTDHAQLIQNLTKAYQRLTNGIYIIWYPINAAGSSYKLQQELALLKNNSNTILQVELQVNLTGNNFGLTGSGLFIINPPYILEAQLNKLMPHLVETLAPIANGFKIKEL